MPSGAPTRRTLPAVRPRPQFQSQQNAIEPASPVPQPPRPCLQPARHHTPAAFLPPRKKAHTIAACETCRRRKVKVRRKGAPPRPPGSCEARPCLGRAGTHPC